MRQRPLFEFMTFPQKSLTHFHVGREGALESWLWQGSYSNGTRFSYILIATPARVNHASILNPGPHNTSEILRSEVMGGDIPQIHIGAGGPAPVTVTCNCQWQASAAATNPLLIPPHQCLALSCTGVAFLICRHFLLVFSSHFIAMYPSEQCPNFNSWIIISTFFSQSVTLSHTTCNSSSHQPGFPSRQQETGKRTVISASLSGVTTAESLSCPSSLLPLSTSEGKRRGARRLSNWG